MPRRNHYWRERGSSEREKHLTYRRERGIGESLGSEEIREQRADEKERRKREKRREIMREKREILGLKRRREY